jgi:hypothetical protein
VRLPKAPGLSGNSTGVGTPYLTSATKTLSDSNPTVVRAATVLGKVVHQLAKTTFPTKTTAQTDDVHPNIQFPRCTPFGAATINYDDTLFHRDKGNIPGSIAGMAVLHFSTSEDDPIQNNVVLPEYNLALRSTHDYVLVGTMFEDVHGNTPRTGRGQPVSFVYYAKRGHRRYSRSLAHAEAQCEKHDGGKHGEPY